jgi:hypothetical protein
LIEDALGARNICGFPFDDELVPVRTDPDAELGLEVLEVLVVAAEQRFDVLVWNGDLADDGSGRYGVAPGRENPAGVSVLHAPGPPDLTAFVKASAVSPERFA